VIRVAQRADWKTVLPTKCLNIHTFEFPMPPHCIDCLSPVALDKWQYPILDSLKFRCETI
jgi:hypothetical protein